MRRTGHLDAKILVKDESQPGSPWLNLYTQWGYTKIQDLFNEGRRDHRLLTFVTEGPEAWVAAKVLCEFVDGPPPSWDEVRPGVSLWPGACWRGVRAKAAARDMGYSLSEQISEVMKNTPLRSEVATLPPYPL